MTENSLFEFCQRCNQWDFIALLYKMTITHKQRFTSAVDQYTISHSAVLEIAKCLATAVHSSYSWFCWTNTFPQTFQLVRFTVLYICLKCISTRYSQFSRIPNIKSICNVVEKLSYFILLNRYIAEVLSFSKLASVPLASAPLCIFFFYIEGIHGFHVFLKPKFQSANSH